MLILRERNVRRMKERISGRQVATFGGRMRMVVQVPDAASLYLQHSCSTPMRMWKVKNI